LNGVENRKLSIFFDKLQFERCHCYSQRGNSEWVHTQDISPVLLNIGFWFHWLILSLYFFFLDLSWRCFHLCKQSESVGFGHCINNRGYGAIFCLMGKGLYCRLDSLY
jgi:hypothetical protein